MPSQGDPGRTTVALREPSHSPGVPLRLMREQRIRLINLISAQRRLMVDSLMSAVVISGGWTRSYNLLSELQLRDMTGHLTGSGAVDFQLMDDCLLMGVLSFLSTSALDRSLNEMKIMFLIRHFLVNALAVM